MWERKRERGGGSGGGGKKSTKPNSPRFSRHCWIFPTSPTSTCGTPISTSQSNCKPRSCALACNIRKVLETNFPMLNGTLSTSRRPASIFARSNTLLIICSSRSAHSFTEIKLSFWSSESSDSNSNAVKPRIPWIGVLHMVQYIWSTFALHALNYSYNSNMEESQKKLWNTVLVVRKDLISWLILARKSDLAWLACSAFLWEIWDSSFAFRSSAVLWSIVCSRFTFIWWSFLVSCFFSRTAAARVMPTIPITVLKSSIWNRSAASVAEDWIWWANTLT